MARTVGIQFDARKLEESLRRLNANYVKVVGPALFDAGNRVLEDAIYIKPMAPKRKGFLRRSARTEGADGLKTAKPGQKNRRAYRSGPSWKILAGFNIVYAARWHELTPAQESLINWTTDKGAPDPGRKYLESKLARFGNEYLEIIGGHVKQFLDSGAK